MHSTLQAKGYIISKTNVFVFELKKLLYEISSMNKV